MKDKKRIEILLKVIQRIFGKNPEIQKLIDRSMIDICKEVGVSPEQIFFVFLCCWLYRNGLSKQLMKILVFIFSGDKNKIDNNAEFCRCLFFDTGILRV